MTRELESVKKEVKEKDAQLLAMQSKVSTHFYFGKIEKTSCC